MIRHLFHRTGSQLIALMLLALLLTHIGSTLAISAERKSAGVHASERSFADRIETMVIALQITPKDEEPALIKAMNSRMMQFSVDPAPLPILQAPLTEREESLRHLLERQLTESGNPAAFRLGFISEPVRPIPMGRLFTDHMPLGFSFPLAEDRWLNVRAHLSHFEPIGDWTWHLPLAIGALVSLIILSLMIGQITRPLRAMEHMADKIGRGEMIAPLPLKGPQEIKASIDAMNLMQSRVQRTVRDKMQMIAALSHDLRSPITSLRIKAEFIEDEALRADFIRILSEMEDMSVSTLSLARGDLDSEETTSVDIGRLLTDIAADKCATGQDVIYDGPTRFDWPCRKGAITRAVTNLTENALRYAGSTHIRIHADGTALGIIVEDQGPGIPEDMLEDVMLPFVRIETSRSRETGGVGLGLAIARSVAHAHGGRLMLENRDSGGLRATLILP